MSDFEAEVLLRALEKATTWEVLHDPDLLSRINPEAFLKLATEVYGKEEAQRQTSALVWERMRREQVT